MRIREGSKSGVVIELCGSVMVAKRYRRFFATRTPLRMTWRGSVGDKTKPARSCRVFRSLSCCLRPRSDRRVRRSNRVASAPRGGNTAQLSIVSTDNARHASCVLRRRSGGSIADGRFRRNRVRGGKAGAVRRACAAGVDKMRAVRTRGLGRVAKIVSGLCTSRSASSRNPGFPDPVMPRLHDLDPRRDRRG